MVVLPVNIESLAMWSYQPLDAGRVNNVSGIFIGKHSQKQRGFPLNRHAKVMCQRHARESTDVSS